MAKILSFLPTHLKGFAAHGIIFTSHTLLRVLAAIEVVLTLRGLRHFFYFLSFRWLIACRTPSGRRICFFSQYSSRISRVSSDTQADTLFGFGSSVGLPIFFFSVKFSPPTFDPKSIILVLGSKVKNFFTFLYNTFLYGFPTTLERFCGAWYNIYAAYAFRVCWRL